jgi:hypothetical protein
MWSSLSVTGRWFCPGTPVSSTNRYGVLIWSLWPNIRSLPSIVAEKNVTKNVHVYVNAKLLLMVSFILWYIIHCKLKIRGRRGRDRMVLRFITIYAISAYHRIYRIRPEWPVLAQGCGMVFNATFNNISVILWGSVLLVEETGVPGQNHRPVTDKCCVHLQKSIFFNAKLLLMVSFILWYIIHCKLKIRGRRAITSTRWTVS